MLEEILEKKRQFLIDNGVIASRIHLTENQMMQLHNDLRDKQLLV